MPTGRVVSSHEKELINYLWCRGINTAVIAELLGIHRQTVRQHFDYSARKDYQQACIQRVREELE